MNQPSTLKERILQYAQVHLGAEPDHLWAKFPRYAVLRHSENAKWFAVFLEVPGTRLGLERPESVDILDVKCGPLLAGSLLGIPGILPAYHMNKSNWVNLLLDGSLPEEEIIRLLEENGLLLKTEPITHTVSVHERCGTSVEIIRLLELSYDLTKPAARRAGRPKAE